MKITKTKQVKTPYKANKTDAGIDFFIPENTATFIKELKEKNNKTIEITEKGFYVLPHSDALIPSGIKMIMPEGYALVAENKSGISTKQKLIVGACVIDEEYRGETHIHLINFSTKKIKIEFGQKAVQFLMVKVPEINIKIITNKEFDKYENTNRGTGGFGSTGIKK